MSSYEDDIKELQKEFLKVNIKDQSSIQQWFANHPYLTTNDHARVANRSVYWIRKLKNFANIKGRMPKNLPKSSRKKTINTIHVPEDWDNDEWLRKQAKLHTVSAISKATGLSRKSIYNRFKKYGIKGKTLDEALEPKSPYFSHKWVYEHYVTKGMSQRDCAKVAGICVQTFSNWLNRLKIAVRNPKEAANNHKDSKIWIREVVHNLEQQDTVRKVFVREDHIHVRFMNYSWETYYFDRTKAKNKTKSFVITKNNSKIKSPPRIMLEYGSELDSGELYPAHITIHKDAWNNASFLEQRLSVHEFVRIINRRGYINPKYPEYVLNDEIASLNDIKINKILQNNAFQVYPRNGKVEIPGNKIIMHFFGNYKIWDSILKKPGLTIRCMNELINNKSKLSYHNLVKNSLYFTKGTPNRFKMLDLRAYITMFKNLGIKGTVLDLYPNYGHRAIACALLGIKYMANPTEAFQEAIDNGFAEFLGLDYEPYDGRKVDMVIGDNDFREINICDTLRYAKNTKRILQFVKHTRRKSLQSEFKPERIIKIQTTFDKSPPDCYFVF